MSISTHFAIVALGILSFWLAFYENVYASFFLPLLFLIFIQKIDVFRFLKKLLLLNIFIIIAIFSVVLHGDYDYAFLIFVRSNTVILITLLLFWEKDIFQIAYGFARLGFPQKLSALFFFIAKFVAIMKEEFVMLQKVMFTRSFQEKSNVFTYSIYANILGVLIIKAFDRAQKLGYAMELRGYKGAIYHGEYEKNSLLDFAFLALVIVSLSFPFARIQI